MRRRWNPRPHPCTTPRTPPRRRTVRCVPPTPCRGRGRARAPRAALGLAPVACLPASLTPVGVVQALRLVTGARMSTVHEAPACSDNPPAPPPPRGRPRRHAVAVRIAHHTPACPCRCKPIATSSLPCSRARTAPAAPRRCSRCLAPQFSLSTARVFPRWLPSLLSNPSSMRAAHANRPPATLPRGVVPSHAPPRAARFW